MNVFEGSRRVAKLVASFIVIGFAVAIVADNSKTTYVNYVIAGPGQPPVLDAACPTESPTKTASLAQYRHISAVLCFLDMEFTFSRNDLDALAKAYGGNPFNRFDEQNKRATPFDDLVPKGKDLAQELYGTESANDSKPWEQDPIISQDTKVRLIPYGFDPKTGKLLGGHKEYSKEVSGYMEKVAVDFRIPPADEDHINRISWFQTLKNAGLYFLGMLASLVSLSAFTWTIGWVVRGFMGIPRGSDRNE